LNFSQDYLFRSVGYESRREVVFYGKPLISISMHVLEHLEQEYARKRNGAFKSFREQVRLAPKWVCHENCASMLEKFHENCARMLEKFHENCARIS
jgi:hypothetical protein